MFLDIWDTAFQYRTYFLHYPNWIVGSALSLCLLITQAHTHSEVQNAKTENWEVLDDITQITGKILHVWIFPRLKKTYSLNLNAKMPAKYFSDKIVSHIHGFLHAAICNFHPSRNWYFLERIDSQLCIWACAHAQLHMFWLKERYHTMAWD